MSANPIIWWELATHDQEKSVRFFEKVFGWEFRFDANVGFYKMKNGNFTLDGGGIFTLRRAKLPFVALYIQVDDIHAGQSPFRRTAASSLTRPPNLPRTNGCVCSMNHRE